MLKEHFSTNNEGIRATMVTAVFTLVAKKVMGVKPSRLKGKGKLKLDEYKENILKLIELKVLKTITEKQYSTCVVIYTDF